MSDRNEEYLDFTEEPSAAASDNFDTIPESWSKNDTFRLISLYKHNQDVYRLDESKMHFWQNMQRKMLKLDVVKTTKSIRTKWSNLIRTYKHVVRNKLNNKEPKKFIYYHAMDEILENEPFGSKAILKNITSKDATSDDDVTFIDNIEVDEEGEHMTFYDQNEEDVVAADKVSNESLNQVPDDIIKNHLVDRKTWKNKYYNNKIDELRDRRRFREKKLELAISREERKIRELELKEKKFQLAKMRFELDKRQVSVEERKLDKGWLKDQ